MTKILAYDTSNKFLSVAVLEDEKVISNFHEDIGMNHSKMLIPTIDKVLKNADLELRDMDAIALNIGPGSFTGLRISVVTAKALSLVTDISVVGVPSLDVIAYGYIDRIERRASRFTLAPMLDAKKNKVYSAIYGAYFGDIKRISGYLLTDAESLLKKLKGPTLFFGDGALIYGKQMTEKSPLVKIMEDADWYPRAEVVGRLGLEKFRKGYREDIDRLVPMYLHPKECNVRGFAY